LGRIAAHALRAIAFQKGWNYTVQTLYFALAASCSAALVLAREDFISRAHLAAAQYAFELSSACGFVVTAVTTFVIWPEKVRCGSPHSLAEVHNLIMHNCNTMESVLEILLGRLPIAASHCPLGVVWGSAYIAFAWTRAPRIRRAGKAQGASEGNGGNFVYSFLDWTLPAGTQLLCIAALVGVLVAFHFGAMGLRLLVQGARALGVPFAARTLGFCAASVGLYRWRD